MKKILDVPKIKQGLSASCGPTCLSMVSTYHGLEFSPEELMGAYFLKRDWEKEGCMSSELITASRELGFIAHSNNNMNLGTIIERIDKDLPIIARIRSSRRGWGHFVVAKGYDRRKLKSQSTIYVNNPIDLKRNKWSWEEFNYKWDMYSRCGWNRTKNYGIVIRLRD